MSTSAPIDAIQATTSANSSLIAPSILTNISNTTITVVAVSDGALDGGGNDFPAGYMLRLFEGPTLFGDTPFLDAGMIGGYTLGGAQNGCAVMFALTPQ